MNFASAFEKVAKVAPGFWGKAGKVLSEAKSHGGKFLAGLESAGKQSLGDTLKLKGITEPIASANKASKGKLLSSQKGRGMLAEAIGKTAPKAAVLAGYGYLGKKVYDKTLGGSGDTSNTNVMSNYYGY